MKLKHKFVMMLVVLIMVLLVSCDAPNPVVPGEVELPDTDIAVPNSDDMFSNKDNKVSYAEDEKVAISLNGTSISCDSSNVVINGQNATITKKGIYEVTGTLYDGQIVVNIDNADKVTVILNNASITATSTAPVYVLSADKVFLNIVGNNELITTNNYIAIDDNNIDGTIFAKDDLTINGTGTLSVTSSYGNGIVAKDDLIIVGTTLNVNAAEDGFDVNDSVRMNNCNVNIKAEHDGIHCENDEDTTLGYIYIDGGTYNITGMLDGIQASSTIQIIKGNFTIKTGGGSANSSSNSGGYWGSVTTESMKGIKATSNIVITSGELTLDTSDDAIHSNGSIQLDGGSYDVTSGDDGIHADSTIIINGGIITISQSYEGIEAQNITINGGTIKISATDDGLNAAGGKDGSGLGRPGFGSFNPNSNCFITITGGNLSVNASGDGIDANGALYVSGGTTIVEGPTSSGNGALDYDGVAQITGGVFVAIGSSGMAQNFGNTSSQASILYNMNSAQNANTEITIMDSNNDILFTHTAKKRYQSVLISGPFITIGKTYKLALGTTTTNITMSSLIYSIGGGMGGGGRPR